MENRELNYESDGRTTAQDVSKRLNDYRAAGGTFARIETETGVSRTAISQLANHGIPVPAVKMDKIIAWLNVNACERGAETPEAAPRAAEAAAEAVASRTVQDGATLRTRPYKSRVEIYETEDYKAILGWCGTIYRMRRISALIGNPRTGKTTAMRGYCAINPAAHYIECWTSQGVNDMLDLMAEPLGIRLTGKTWTREKQLVDALRGRSDIMYIFDEAEYMEKKNGSIEKLEVARKIFDNTGTPIILCGTPELGRVLTRGNSSANRAQLYGRMWRTAETAGMSEAEAIRMLDEYNCAPDAARELATVAADKKYGGMGNFAEILSICLEASEGGQIDLQMVRDAKKYKMFI